MQRILVHFSCGAASAVAWKATEERYGKDYDVEAVYCDLLNNEHPDNVRFMADVEKWVGKEVTLLQHKKYRDIDTLFLDTGYIVGPRGASCTSTLKSDLRKAYQRATDKHVFGYTSDESNRIAVFSANNPDLECLWVLSQLGITKSVCYRIILAAGIKLPVMYELGYGHNNCIGCVKGGKGYWNKIRVDFPQVFEQRAAVQRALGVKFGGGNGFFLDELGPDEGKEEPPQDIECGPFCSSYSGPIGDFTPLPIVDASPTPKRLR